MIMIMPDAQCLSRDQILGTKALAKKFRSTCRLSILLKAVEDAEQIDSICRKLKLSRKQTKMMMACNIWGQALDVVPPTQANFMALIDQCDEIEDGFFLGALVPSWNILFPEHRDIIKKARITEETKRYLRKSPLPLKSKDLMIKFNLVPGPRLGEIKGKLTESYRNEDWHTSDEGIHWLEENLGQIP